MLVGLCAQWIVNVDVEKYQTLVENANGFTTPLLLG